MPPSSSRSSSKSRNSDSESETGSVDPTTGKKHYYRHGRKMNRKQKTDFDKLRNTLKVLVDEKKIAPATKHTILTTVSGMHNKNKKPLPGICKLNDIPYTLNKNKKENKELTIHIIKRVLDKVGIIKIRGVVDFKILLPGLINQVYNIPDARKTEKGKPLPVYTADSFDKSRIIEHIHGNINAHKIHIPEYNGKKRTGKYIPLTMETFNKWMQGRKGNDATYKEKLLQRSFKKLLSMKRYSMPKTSSEGGRADRSRSSSISSISSHGSKRGDPQPVLDSDSD